MNTVVKIFILIILIIFFAIIFFAIIFCLKKDDQSVSEDMNQNIRRSEENNQLQSIANIQNINNFRTEVHRLTFEQTLNLEKLLKNKNNIQKNEVISDHLADTLFENI